MDFAHQPAPTMIHQIATSYPLKGRVGECGNHFFWYPVNHWFKKQNPEALIRSQTIVEDLPYSH